jgi:hypothetical protein
MGALPSAMLLRSIKDLQPSDSFDAKSIQHDVLTSFHGSVFHDGTLTVSQVCRSVCHLTGYLDSVKYILDVATFLLYNG